ncbi:hypothetical protein THIOM_003668 [Candidatus Thiomargarita nelsonii]|uniref:Uncharacterized protein n=1 Tax=Candidatus Thiomargarita nelsonii TaxID=1003181 RepID=A0A176RY46_9GAMM|nr:hypothetical protein THIOM_003668 [Candidatus Thiomargarita nelsonii]
MNKGGISPLSPRLMRTQGYLQYLRVHFFLCGRLTTSSVCHVTLKIKKCKVFFCALKS